MPAVKTKTFPKLNKREDNSPILPADHTFTLPGALVRK